MYAFDTDTCIEFLHGNLPLAYKIMRSSDPSLFGIPAVVEGELRLGAEKSSRTLDAMISVERFLAPLALLPFDSACATQYAKIRCFLEGKGCVIGQNDMLIAATALANNATLVTNNTREFQRIPGLSVESWTEVEV